MRASLVRLALIALIALSAQGCMEPLQSGGVMIVGDPSSRMEVLCRLHDRPGDPFCAARVKAEDEGFLD